MVNASSERNHISGLLNRFVERICFMVAFSNILFLTEALRSDKCFNNDEVILCQSRIIRNGNFVRKGFYMICKV